MNEAIQPRRLNSQASEKPSPVNSLDAVSDQRAFWHGVSEKQALDIWTAHATEELNAESAIGERKLLKKMLGLKKDMFTPGEVQMGLDRYADTLDEQGKIKSGIDLFVGDIITAHNKSWEKVLKNRKSIENLAAWFGEDAKETIIEHTLERITQDPVPGITRREFIRRTAIITGAALIPQVARLASSEEVRYGLKAATSRPEPEDLTMHEYSSDAIKSIYQTYFSSETGMDYNAWVGNNGFAINLGRLANLSYAKERQENETFDEYITRWTKQLYDISQQFNLNFTVLVASLKTSGENIGDLKKAAEDTSITKVQSRFPLLRELGIDEKLLDFIGPKGVTDFMLKSESVRRSNIRVKDPSVPPGGIWHYDLIRLQSSAVTTGYMDYEPGERVQGLYSLPPKMQEIFTKAYPEVAKVYEKTNNIHAAREQVRSQLKSVALGFIDAFPEDLLVFIEDSEQGKQAREAIGLGEKVSSWQRLHYTDAWVEQAKTPRTEVSLGNRVVTSMRAQHEANPRKFAEEFLSQQILNDKFVQYLFAQALHKKDTNRQDQVKDLWIAQKQYKQATKDLSAAYLNVADHEGYLEFDSRFQQMTTVMVTKHLSELGGTFNDKDRDSLFWHIYRISCLREMSSPYVIVHGSEFAKDPIADHPYDRVAFLEVFDRYIDYMLELGVIKKHPSKDIRSFWTKTDQFRNRSFGEWSFPTLSGEEWTTFIKFYHQNIVTRAYVDNGRWNEIRESQNMDNFINLLLEKKLLTNIPEEDVLQFYQVFENVMRQRYYVYPHLTENDGKEIEEFIKTKISPAFRTKVKSDWGGFDISSPVNYQEYPPIVRAQDMVWWLADRGNDTQLDHK